MTPHLSNTNFNSIKVRLERIGSAISAGANLLFQFHKGTIRTVTLDSTSGIRSNFNSIKVRLERSNRWVVAYFRSDFNSIKVRLELTLLNLLIFLQSKFQFHKGTIRTSFAIAKMSSLVFIYFNSIKVRLEPCCRYQCLQTSPISIP